MPLDPCNGAHILGKCDQNARLVTVHIAIVIAITITIFSMVNDDYSRGSISIECFNS